jgi:hypothetical protein
VEDYGSRRKGGGGCVGGRQDDMIFRALSSQRFGGERSSRTGSHFGGTGGSRAIWGGCCSGVGSGRQYLDSGGSRQYLST